MYIVYKNIPLMLFTVILVATAPIFSVQAQSFKEPWGFAPQNRAAIASMIRQVEMEKKSAATMTNTGTTILTCGKGEASSEANSACIIMNNSDGILNVGQDSVGSQTTSNTKTQVQSTSDADAVLAALNGGN